MSELTKAIIEEVKKETSKVVAIHQHPLFTEIVPSEVNHYYQLILLDVSEECPIKILVVKFLGTTKRIGQDPEWNFEDPLGRHIVLKGKTLDKWFVRGM
jgi:hypothetical protein